MLHKRIFGLDVLRSIAIVMVVVGHGMQLLPSYGEIGSLMNSFLYLGVELFFVLSGFLIGRILLESFHKHSGLPDLTRFWQRRWWRTLPNYYLFLVINLIGFGLLKDGFQFDYSYLVFLQNFLAPNAGFFSVSWSLAVEEWFYLLTPIVYLCCLKLSNNANTAFAWLFFTIVGGTFLLRWLYIINGDVTWNDEMRRVVVLRLDSLMWGVAAAWVWIHFREVAVSQRINAAFVGLAFICASVWMRNHPAINATPWMLMLVFPFASIGAALFLPLLANWRTTQAGAAAKSFFTYTSIWSYSLYLIHVPLLEIYRILFYGKIVNAPVVQLIGFTLWIALAYFLSFLVYRLFESPMTNLRESSSRKQSTAVTDN